jgi:hypothetical protein
MKPNVHMGSGHPKAKKDRNSMGAAILGYDATEMSDSSAENQ